MTSQPDLVANSDLIERVARAIDDAADAPGDDKWEAPSWEMWEPEARAAIEAVLEEMWNSFDCPGASDVETAIEMFAKENGIFSFLKKENKIMSDTAGKLVEWIFEELGVFNSGIEPAVRLTLRNAERASYQRGLEDGSQEVVAIFDAKPKEYGHGKQYCEGYANALLEANEAISRLKQTKEESK